MNNDRLTRWFVGTLIAVFVLQLLYGVGVYFLYGPHWETRGQFGDMFGGINAFFTGLAFAGVIFTILLQRQELELQRDELRMTRDELHTSAQAQQEQVSQLKEAANLSALTALLSVYTSELQPLRDITRDYRRDLASIRATRKRTDLLPSQYESLDKDIEEIEVRMANQEAEWSDLLAKNRTLVSRLEALIEHVGESDTSPSG